jgi:hypothetical protein
VPDHTDITEPEVLESVQYQATAKTSTQPYVLTKKTNFVGCQEETTIIASNVAVAFWSRSPADPRLFTTGQSEKGSSDQIKRNNVKESFASPRSTPVTNNRRLYDKEQIARDGGKDVYSDEAGLIVTPLAEAVTKPFCLYRCSLLDL